MRKRHIPRIIAALMLAVVCITGMAAANDRINNKLPILKQDNRGYKLPPLVVYNKSNGTYETVVSYDIVMEEDSPIRQTGITIEEQQLAYLLQAFFYIGMGIILGCSFVFCKGDVKAWFLIFIELMSIYAMTGGWIVGNAWLEMNDPIGQDVTMSIKIERQCQEYSEDQRKLQIFDLLSYIQSVFNWNPSIEPFKS